MLCLCNDPTISGSDAPVPHEVGTDGCVFDEDAVADRRAEDLEFAALTWLESLVPRFGGAADLTGWIVA